MYGLVAPGYAMAEVVVDALLDGPGTFTGADMSTKLKLLGVDVASFGDAFAATDGALELVYSDAVAGVYKKLVISEDGTRLLGGILVGDASAYGVLRPLVASGIALPANPESLILPASSGRRAARHARRGAGLLVQRRDQGPDQARGQRGGLRDGRRRQEVHPRRQHLRQLRERRQEHHRGALRERRQGRRQGPVRALPAQSPGALRRGRGARLQAVRRHRRGARHRSRLRHLQAGDRQHPGQPVQRARARPQEPRSCRTPTTPTSPTSSATAPTRSCRASRAARSRRTS